MQQDSDWFLTWPFYGINWNTPPPISVDPVTTKQIPPVLTQVYPYYDFTTIDEELVADVYQHQKMFICSEKCSKLLEKPWT